MSLPLCLSCVPPPDPESFRSYKLVDEAGSSTVRSPPVPAGLTAVRADTSTGALCEQEKLLRTQLAFCPEWASDAGRHALADAVEAGTLAGSPSLVHLLRAKDCSAVRKDHMLFMCLAWHYRTPFWSAKRPRTAGHAGSAAQQQQRAVVPRLAGPAGWVGAQRGAASRGGAARGGGCDDENNSPQVSEPGTDLVCAADALACMPVLALRDRCLVTICAATCSLAAVVRPMVDSSVAGWAAERSAAAFSAVGGRNIGWWRVQHFLGTLQLYGFLRSHMQQRLYQVRAMRESLTGGDMSTPAYTRDLGHLCPVPIIEACRTLLVMGDKLTIHQVNAFRFGEGIGDLPSHEAAWLEDFRQAKAGCMAILAVLDSAVEQRRLGPLPQFLEAVEAVTEALVSMTELTEEAVRRRLVWMTHLAELRGPAAGKKAQAFNLVAPLMQVIRVNHQHQRTQGPVITVIEDAVALPPVWRAEHPAT